MNKKYIEENTRTWVLEEQCKNLKLYTYFDQVDWENRWAILDNDGNCLYAWDDCAHGNNYDFFTAVVEIMSNIKL